MPTYHPPIIAKKLQRLQKSSCLPTITRRFERDMNPRQRIEMIGLQDATYGWVQCILTRTGRRTVNIQNALTIVPVSAIIMPTGCGIDEIAGGLSET